MTTSTNRGYGRGMGPWLPITHWKSWVEKEMGRRNIDRTAMASVFGIQNRILYRWLAPECRAIHRDKVEDLLWAYDTVRFDEVFEETMLIEKYIDVPDPEGFRNIPRKRKATKT